MLRKHPALERNDPEKVLADLHWLAFLLTGSHAIATDIAIESFASSEDAQSFFTDWMVAWARRLAIAKALAPVREALSASAGMMKFRRGGRTAVPEQSWSRPTDKTKLDLERALLPIDIFPRAALLLSSFEGLPLQDAAILLDVHPDAVRNAQVIGLQELTSNLATTRSWTPTSDMEVQYA